MIKVIIFIAIVLVVNAGLAHFDYEKKIAEYRLKWRGRDKTNAPEPPEYWDTYAAYLLTGASLFIVFILFLAFEFIS